MIGKMKIKIFCVILFLLLSLNTASSAADLSFEVTVDRNKISLGSSTKLNLSFYGTQDVPIPDMPDIDGFQTRYVGPSTRISIVNGKVSNSITHVYTLFPLKAGRFKIPSLSVRYDGRDYMSSPIPIEVAQGRVRQTEREPRQEIYDNKPQDLEDRIFLVMQAEKNEAYVNEIIPLTIKLYVNNLAIRDIQYPEFAHEGFSTEGFSEPEQYQESLSGLIYDLIEFKTDVFAMYPGEMELGPANLECNLAVRKKTGRRRSSFFHEDFFGSDMFDDFFSRYEIHPLDLKSDPISIVIKKLPEENMPEHFNGALGNYRFYIEAEPKNVKVGDPITLKMTIVGVGNFRTVSPPYIDFGDYFKVYEPELKQEKTKKTFEQVIIPKNDSIMEIPEANFSFFNPKTGAYKTITTPETPIKVNPLSDGEKLKVFELPFSALKEIHKKKVLGRDIIYIKESPGRLKRRGSFLCRNKLFIVIQFIPLLAIISILIFERREERLRTDIRYARRARAPRKAKKNLLKTRRLLDLKKTDEFFEVVFKTLQEYLGDKFHLPSAGITSSVVEEELKPRNIEPNILEKIKQCFTSCDTARYAPASITEEEMLKVFKVLEEIIDKLERAKT